MRNSICAQTEAALVAALSTLTNSGPLGSCNIHRRQDVDLENPLAPPAAVVIAADPKEVAYGTNLFELKLSFRVETQIDSEQGNSPSEVHHLRVGALRDFLDHFDRVSALVNAPAFGPDLRTIRYTLSALAFESEAQEQSGRIFVSELAYYACAEPA